MIIHPNTPISAFHLYNALKDADDDLLEHIAAQLPTSADRQALVLMLQAAERSLNEIHSRLLRMRELALQAVDETVPPQGRESIQLEIDKLKEEINEIARGVPLDL